MRTYFAVAITDGNSSFTGEGIAQSDVNANATRSKFATDVKLRSLQGEEVTQVNTVLHHGVQEVLSQVGRGEAARDN